METFSIKNKKLKEITVPVTFKGRVKAENIEIMDNVLIDTINGVDVTDIGQRLIRKSSDTFVKGLKIFQNGFSTNHLYSGENFFFIHTKKIK